MTFDAEDAFSAIAHAEYSLDAGPWQYIEPVGGLSDSKREHYEFRFPASGGQASEHLITVRAYDRHDNVGAAKTVIRRGKEVGGAMRFELLCSSAIPQGQAAASRGGRGHGHLHRRRAAGVAALIIALAITNGMRRDLQDRLLGSLGACGPDAHPVRRHSRLAAAA